MRNEPHHRSRILTTFEIFSDILGAIIALVHLNLHHLWILLRWSMQAIICKLVLVLHLCRSGLLHQILSSKGHTVFKLLLHLFEIYELARLLHIIELSNISILNLHIVLDWCSPFVVYFTVFHGFTANKVSWGTWCRKCTAALTSVHVCEVSEIRGKILLSHFELSAVLLQVLHVAM